jgi:hypothetical protein
LCKLISAAKLEEFEQLLLRRLGGQGKNLCVAVQEGCVVLQGLVQTYYVKQCVQNLALQVFETVELVNAIEVRSG